MLVARLQQGLLRLRTVLPKFKMADAIPKEATAVAKVTQSPEDSQASSGNKRPLESMEQIGSVSSVATATSAATTQADTAATTLATTVAVTETTPIATVAATPVTTVTATTIVSSEATAVAVAASTEEPAPKKLKTEDDSSNASPLKIVKRKVAMLLSYSGVGYKGMQKNPGEKTIEEDLAHALLKCQAITEEQAQNFGKMAFQRCARTDKGVSAAGQVVSLKMKIFDNVVGRINEYLPPCIRVMGIKRTTGSFNSKYNCDFRTYIYMLPTFAFEPIEEITTESYRVTEEKLQEVKELLMLYIGTHNFHNFTSGKLFKDPSAYRYIREFTCDEPYIYEGLEFVILRVRGQSFVLHQIRKMIGLVIAIAKGFAPKDTLERAFGEDKLDIPRAPGLGLVLESVHYDVYNRRWGSDGMHEALTWDDCKDDLEAFKKEHIYPTIVSTEKKQRAMMQWLSTLPLHTYDVIETPNPYRGLASHIEKDRREKKERLNMSSANSGNKEERPLESASSSHRAQGDGGPEVTSTTGQEQSHQVGGPDGTSVEDKHEAECKTSSSEVQPAGHSVETQDRVPMETGKANETREEISSTSKGPDPGIGTT
ncbi:tRNA pseudouridine synthase A-like [Patiria miniata]|uniref:Pseudouridylate synthase 1 homolog n=1 Tax=Patiria miniata TaxID=46514 RepID=A0A913Z6C5_PATMI|nr:tRNA pseudouridine synthase A-like [Patiria miniata]